MAAVPAGLRPCSGSLEQTSKHMALSFSVTHVHGPDRTFTVWLGLGATLLVNLSLTLGLG